MFPVKPLGGFLRRHGSWLLRPWSWESGFEFTVEPTCCLAWLQTDEADEESVVAVAEVDEVVLNRNMKGGESYARF